MKLTPAYFIKIGVLAAVYFGVTKLTFGYSVLSGNITIVWPPAGIALAALLLWGNNYWPGIALGAFLVDVSMGTKLMPVCCMAAGKTLGALTGSWLLHRFAGFRNALDRVQDVLGLVTLAAMLSTTVTATIGLTGLYLDGYIPQPALGVTWLVWWVGDAAGILVVTPVFLTWGVRPRLNLQLRQVAEAVLLFIALIVLTGFVFGAFVQLETKSYPLAYAVFPFLIWIALRFGQREAVTAFFVVTCIAIFGTTHNFAPFKKGSFNESLTFLQMFIAVASVTTMILAALIAEGKQAAEKLGQSEVQYRTLVEHATEAIVVLDVDAEQFVDVNENALQFFHLSKEELYRSGLADMSPSVQPDGRPSGVFVKEKLEQALDGGTPVFEWVYRNLQMKKITCEVRLLRLPVPGRRLVRGSITDISERKRIETALQASEQKYRGLVETSQDLIWSMNLKGHLTFVNRAAKRIYGYEPEEMIGRLFTEFKTPEQAAKDLRMFERIVSGENIFGYETRTLRRDGTSVTMLSNAITLRNEQGIIIGATGTSTDITERNRAEEAFRESEARYRDLFENASDIIFTRDLTGRFTSLNKAGERILGYTTEEVRHIYFSQIVAPEYRKLTEETTGRKLRGEVAVTTYELEIITKDDRRVALEVSTRLIIQNGQPGGVQGIARDVTERKSLEAQLRQSQKMEAIGQLAGGIAHDFNNLLTAIIGYSDLLQRRLEKGSPLFNYTGEIKKAADRAASLTQQLLAFSRKQLMHPKVLNLNTVVTDVAKMLQRLLGEQIELMTILNPELEPVQADPHQIEQVIVNLAVNARDAMPDGGRLIIRTGNVERDWGLETGEREYWRNNLKEPPSDYVMLEVCDSGCGMDDETQAHIFEPFFTTKEVGKGTGLGLSVVDGIVAQSSGHLEVSSLIGEGTSVKIYLPRFVSENGRKGLHEKEDTFSGGASAASPTVERETILLVEDETIVRKLLCETLESQGYKVLEASHGEDAVVICAEYQGEIHLLLTDVVMPHISGPELFRRIVSKRPATRVIFMSGYPKDTDSADKDVLNEESAFLQKPFKARELFEKVRELLDNPPANDKETR